MRKFGLYTLILIIICAAAIAGYVEFGPLPRYKVSNPDVRVIQSKEQINEGRRIAKIICIRCHYNFETGTLAGRRHGNPKRLGDFSSGNITNDSATGIGKWSNGQLYYFLKTGIKPDGNYVFDMPKYPNMCEEDILSIIAFFRSNDSLVRKTNNETPSPRLSFLARALLQFVIRPPSFENRVVSYPDTDNAIAFGRYLATAKFSCYECHSLNMVTTNYNCPEKSWNFFKGGNPHVNEQREKIYTPNITGDSAKGIGRWTNKQFARTLQNGIKPDGSTVRDPMFPFYLLTEKETESIFIYLKSIKN